MILCIVTFFFFPAVVSLPFKHEMSRHINFSLIIVTFKINHSHSHLFSMGSVVKRIEVHLKDKALQNNLHRGAVSFTVL